jgi:hypothetical protein
LSDWIEPLAQSILEDRVDRGETLEGARRKATRYARFLESLSQPHDVATCPYERELRAWPGDIGFHVGQSTVLVAKQGAGKTNAISLLVQKALRHRPTWDVYTNVPFPWDDELRGIVPAPAHLHTVASMSQVLRGIATTILADRIPALAIDEMDQVSTSHEWANERSESWTKFLYVERHFRVRGPLLAYHVHQHVPLPLRRIGALRGSYFAIVVKGGERLLARVEDLSKWWVVGESALPFQTLGLRGFEIDVDMADLEAGLDSGNYKKVARQLLVYLDGLGQGAKPRTEVDRHAAREAVQEEIIRLLVANPLLKTGTLRTRFHTSNRVIADLRAEADIRRARARDPPRVQRPGTEGVSP